MFEWLVDNPFIVVLIGIWLFRLLFGKKEKQEEGKVRAAKKVEVESGERKKSFFEDLDDKIRQLEGAAKKEAATVRTEAAPAPAAIPAKTTAPQRQPVQPAVIRPAAVQPAPQPVTVAPADPFAFRSSTAARVSEEIDYDLHESAFAYHSANHMPVVHEFKPSVFLPFRQAGTITAIDQPENEPEPEVHSLFDDADDLRRAILIMEILGPPKGRRMGRGSRHAPIR